MERPLYNLQSKCRNLRWDKYKRYWWCAGTSMCYKHYDQCPLVEGTAKEILLGNMTIYQIKPDSIRRGIKQWIENKQQPRQLDFDFTDNS